jgi:alpha-N-arabinofuranosidase
VYPATTEHYFPINNATLAVAFTSAPLSKALTGGLRVTTGSKNSTGKIGFKNEGYWGIDVRQQKYTGSFWVKGNYNMTFTVALASNLTNETFATVEVPSQSNATRWTEHTFELTPSYNASNSNNTFSVTFDPAGTDKGTLDFNLISLFPPTYKNRANGLRVDIAQALADMNPVS